MILRRLAFCLGLALAFVASQGAEYAQQYRQRLGGAADELNRMLADFDVDSARLGLTREQGVARLLSNADELARARGERLREDSARAARLSRQLAAFETAGPIARIVVLARDFDGPIAARAWAAYEPAAPVTGEGLALAGFGFLTGWGALRFLGAVRRRAAPRSRVRA
jgi:hypothetical protein